MLEVPKLLTNFAADMENNVVKKPRLEWLDALRGFTMILVVAFHTIQGFGLEMKASSSMQFLDGRGQSLTSVSVIPTLCFFFYL